MVVDQVVVRVVLPQILPAWAAAAAVGVSAQQLLLMPLIFPHPLQSQSRKKKLAGREAQLRTVRLVRQGIALRLGHT